MEQFAHSPNLDTVPAAPNFLDYVGRKLKEISGLPDDWDGEGGEAPTPSSVAAMSSALMGVAGERTVFPYLSPSGEGGVSAEWHAASQKIAIEADHQGIVTADASDQAGQSLLNGPLREGNREVLSGVLSDLSRRVEAENPNWRELFL